VTQTEADCIVEPEVKKQRFSESNSNKQEGESEGASFITRSTGGKLLGALQRYNIYTKEGEVSESVNNYITGSGEGKLVEALKDYNIYIFKKRLCEVPEVNTNCNKSQRPRSQSF
jgi:hypothetical protein